MLDPVYIKFKKPKQCLRKLQEKATLQQNKSNLTTKWGNSILWNSTPSTSAADEWDKLGILGS